MWNIVCLVGNPKLLNEVNSSIPNGIPVDEYRLGEI